MEYLSWFWRGFLNKNLFTQYFFYGNRVFTFPLHFLEGILEFKNIFFRHGQGHKFNPSQVNYRANIRALWQAGCTHILATTCCGSLRQISNIDFTKKWFYLLLLFYKYFLGMTIHLELWLSWIHS